MNGGISGTGLPEYSERAKRSGILSSSTIKAATLAGLVITSELPPPKKGMYTSSSSIEYKPIPYSPLREEDGVKYYDLYDVVAYGEPCEYGIERYLVIDNYEISRPLVMSWKSEQERGPIRGPHRYSASKRFEYLLRQLLGGCRDAVPEEVVYNVKDNLETEDPSKIWNCVRIILKNNGHKKYYNRIPDILKAIGYPLEIKWKEDIIDLVRDFSAINAFFYEFEFDKRVYFPNFKFFALKLLEHRGAIFEYDVPLLRTGKKLEDFEKLWETLYEALY